jgi:FKBP-type peptidyl-prolyl cis-trans isomerase 2
MRELLEPGQYVRHPGEPDWGIGQVQSVAGPRVTVNFEHAGKKLIETSRVTLDLLPDEAVR